MLVVIISTILPRLAALGDFPYLDDGYHAFMAQYIHHYVATGNGFPKDVIGYKLYELLFFWVWALPGNSLVWLRAADLAIAAIAGWLLCGLLITESRSRAVGLLLALATLAGLNYPGVIQSGFKFSFFPAYCCFFLAMKVVHAAAPYSLRWFFAGALAALGVLFRETFFPFVLLGIAALVYSRNFAALLRFILGGIVTAILLTAVISICRGQFYEIFEFYLVYGKVYGPEAGRRWLKFLENGGRAAVIFLPLLLLSCLAFISLLRGNCRQLRARALFWLCAAILPLFEPLLKIGFLYHFSVCLPGLAGFCACAYRCLPTDRIRQRKIGVCAAGVACCFMLPPLFGHLAKASVTWETLKAFPETGWPETLANKSTTLQAAAKIRKLIPPGGKVASTGFAYFIFPASGSLPPKIALADLSRTFIYAGNNPAAFSAKLRANPPDLILIAHAEADHSEIFESELKDIIRALGKYEPACLIPTQLDKNYGWLGYSLYVKKRD